jgi:hypothetical protein
MTIRRWIMEPKHTDTHSISEEYPGVSVQVSWYSWGFMILYTAATIEELLESGCVTEKMFESLGEKKAGKSRIDEDGDRWCRYKKPSKSMPGKVQVVRYISDEDKALSLPGVRFAMDCENARLAERTGIDMTLGDLNRLGLGIPRTKTRTFRSLGRPLTYMLAGSLIFVDWQRARPVS